MYNHKTYEAILQSMLNEVPNDIDKRQGSIIYDALAPAAVELAKAYIELDNILKLTFADSSSGEYLTRRCAEFGVNRQGSTKAIRQAVFEGAMPDIGDRFSLNELTYKVVDILGGMQNIKLQCEQSGEIGNRDTGNLISISVIPNLTKATLTNILVPGDYQENDEDLYKRYLRIINEPAYGGNVNQYRDWILNMDAVGDVKIFPLWNGAGTVKAVIVNSLRQVPSATLITNIQNALDPHKDGMGFGLVPIGHVFTAEPATAENINITVEVELNSGYSVSDIQNSVEEVINNYLNTIAFKKTTIRASYINSAILNVYGVSDVVSLSINGNNNNVIISETAVPVLGVVTISAN